MFVDIVMQVKTTDSYMQKRWLPWATALTIAVVTLIAFIPVLHNGFILWDDGIYIYQNQTLQLPLSASIPYFFGLNFFVGNYHPFTMIAYALLYQIVGKEPEVFHAASLFIHILNVLLVFWFIWLLSGKKLIIAAITSLLFGIHPMHVESVAWAAELKDVLYTAFFLAGLICYLKYLKPEDTLPSSKPVSFLLLTFIFFLFSALSKPAAVVFPLLLWVIDFYFRRPVDKRMLLEKMPFIVIAFAFGIIAIKAQQEDHLLHSYYPLLLRMIFASYSLLAYIVKLAVPFNLASIYPYPALHDGLAPLYFYLAPVLVGLFVYGIYRTKGNVRHLLVFSGLFYFVAIAPELQLISVGDAMMADRYTYVPSIGLFFAFAVGVHSLWHNGTVHKQMVRKVVVIGLTAVSSIYAVSTYARCETWKSSETIAEDLYSKQQQAPVAAHNMGAVLYNKGKYREAIPFFYALRNDKEHFAKDYVLLANSYVANNEPDSAYYLIASLGPDATKNYCEQDLSLSRDLLNSQHFEPAAMFLAVYTRLQKNDPQGYIALAECYYKLNMHSRYINTIDSGLKYCPGQYSLLNHKGYDLFLEGKYEQAIPYFEEALKNAPGYEAASRNLANCYHALDSIKAGLR